MPRANDCVEEAAARVELQFGNALTDLSEQLFDGVGSDSVGFLKLEVRLERDIRQTARSPARTKTTKATEFASKNFRL